MCRLPRPAPPGFLFLRSWHQPSSQQVANIADLPCKSAANPNRPKCAIFKTCPRPQGLRLSVQVKSCFIGWKCGACNTFKRWILCSERCWDLICNDLHFGTLLYVVRDSSVIGRLMPAIGHHKYSKYACKPFGIRLGT